MAEVLLFSYGTLQDPAVQQAIFGRTLSGTPDGLTGFFIGQIAIEDPEVVAQSGLTHHLILHPSDGPTETIPGTVFRLTDAELAAADVYEAEDYTRVLVSLTSGSEAWVYIAAGHSSAGDLARADTSP